MSFIFGPVPSRRLGRSLGIDVVPAKTCSFDCIYCESGPTTHLTVKQEDFSAPSEVLRELNEFFHLFQNGTDVITFSSAGEPTLYSQLGELIAAVKKAHPEYPLIVLTNGSLLWKPEVRKALLKADRIVPSLDAVTSKVFREINKPHPSLELSMIVDGIREFRHEYRGQLHVEIVLVSGVNDSAEELSSLADVLELIKPDCIELNTVVRPPAFTGTTGLPRAQMEKAACFFQRQNAQIIGSFTAETADSTEEELGRRILQTVERRPCTVSELAAALGIPEDTLADESRKLEKQGKLKLVSFDGKLFLSHPQSQ
ncbi:MAG: radical SAM protein [Syntrophobacteraceae bacterium]